MPAERRSILSSSSFSQPKRAAIALDERRAVPAREMCVDLAQVAGEQRRKREHDEHLAEVEDQIENDCHTDSAISSPTSPAMTRVGERHIVMNCARLTPGA